MALRKAALADSELLFAMEQMRAADAFWAAPFAPFDYLTIGFCLPADRLPMLVRELQPVVVTIAGERFVRPAEIAHRLRGYKGVLPILGGKDE